MMGLGLADGGQDIPVGFHLEVTPHWVGPCLPEWFESWLGLGVARFVNLVQ
jgi:hypothetical protein